VSGGVHVGDSEPVSRGHVQSGRDGRVHAVSSGSVWGRPRCRRRRLLWELHRGVRVRRWEHVGHGVHVPARHVQSGWGGQLHTVCARHLRQHVGSGDGILHGAVSRGHVWRDVGPVVGQLLWELQCGVRVSCGVCERHRCDLPSRQLQHRGVGDVHAVCRRAVRGRAGSDHQWVHGRLQCGVRVRSGVDQPHSGRVCGRQVQLCRGG